MAASRIAGSRRFSSSATCSSTGPRSTVDGVEERRALLGAEVVDLALDGRVGDERLVEQRRRRRATMRQRVQGLLLGVVVGGELVDDLADQ